MGAFGESLFGESAFGQAAPLGGEAPLASISPLVALGMPTAGGVSSSAAKQETLSASSDPVKLKTAGGMKQESRNVWSFLPTIGFSNPYSTKPKAKPQEAPTSTFTGPVDLFNLPGEQERKQARMSALRPIDGNATSDFIAQGIESAFVPMIWNRVDSERLKAIEQDLYTYTGSDLRVMVEVAGGSGKYKQLMELSTITTSIHREKSPVRSCGYVNPKAFAYGRRTIAGTIILTQFWMDSLLRFVAENPIPSMNGDFLFSEYYQSLPRASRDTTYHKIDQLPPLNFTFYFADEYGHASVRQLLGVTLVTDGTVYSMNDSLTEQTISYMAMDFTPLQPIEIMGKLREFAQNHRTPKDVAQTWINPKDTTFPQRQNIPLDIPQPNFLVDPRKVTSSAKRLLPPWLGGI